MKRKMTSSIAVALTVLLSVMTVVPTARGQQRKKPIADTGVMTPGAGQVLRLTVNGQGGNDTIAIRFAWKQFVGGTCSAVMGATLCRHTVASEGISMPVTLGPDEAASLDVPGNGAGVQVLVFSNDTNVRVLGQIIDTQTGNVVAVWTACGVN
jgi:hypothetical protein